LSRRQAQTIQIILIIILIVLFLLYRSRQPAKQPPHTQQEISCGSPCGEERWAVKTLTDSDAGSVNFSPQPTTVGWLVSQAAPAALPEDARIAPIETQTYVVRAQLVGFKLEKDRDFHVVIADLDTPTETMIVEIPSSSCSGVCASPRVADINAARAAFVSMFGEPIERFQRTSGTVQVTGVAFFDFLHHQTGVAPNGIELHPVLNIQRE